MNSFFQVFTESFVDTLIEPREAWSELTAVAQMECVEKKKKLFKLQTSPSTKRNETISDTGLSNKHEGKQASVCATTKQHFSLPNIGLSFYLTYYVLLHIKDILTSIF